MKSGSNVMTTYQIVVLGLLEADWCLWLEGMQVTPEPEQGVTCISGTVRDQAELFGVLNQLQALNVVVLRFEQKSSPITSSNKIIQDR
jgi:hypothetical protein